MRERGKEYIDRAKVIEMLEDWSAAERGYQAMDTIQEAIFRVMEIMPEETAAAETAVKGDYQRGYHDGWKDGFANGRANAQEETGGTAE